MFQLTDNDIDLGTSSLEFKDAYFDGTVTSDAFAGPLTGNVTGNASGTAATVTGAAQSVHITSLGTLTALTVDNLGINGNTITANSGAVNITPARWFSYRFRWCNKCRCRSSYWCNFNYINSICWWINW